MAALIKKGLIAAAGLVGAVALDRTSAPIWLLFGTVAVFLVVAVSIDWFLFSWRRQLYLGVVAVGWVLVVVLALQKASDGLSVTINCAPVALPLHDASGGSLFAIYLDPKWGNRVASAHTNGWPSWATQKDAAYGCQVVNNTAVALHGLLFRISVTFRERSGLPPTCVIEATSPVSLGPHASVLFHIADDTRQATEAVLPSSVTARVNEDQQSRTIPARYSTIDGAPIKLRGFNP